jgi:hypothetical protein
MLLPKIDLVVYEARIFGQTLDQTVNHIQTVAFRAVTTSFEKQNEGAKGWSEEDTGISRCQYEDHIREEWMVKVRALSTMTFALMETQLLGFIKMIKEAFLASHFERRKEKYGKKGDGEFLRLVAEYRECYDIELEGLDGFKTCQEITLARNACIHGECAPSDDYKQKTAHRFLVDDRLILNQETLAMAITDMKTFAEALASATRKRIDGVKAVKAKEA